MYFRIGIFILLSMLLVSGCATKRYGRLQPVSDVERAEYTCRELKIELSKIDAFDKQVAVIGRFNAKTVFGFLGDFGIGNGMEKGSARNSSIVRRRELDAAAREKHCELATPSA